MSEYFPDLKSSGGKVKFVYYLSYYATKADLKNATGVEISKFTKNVDLASLKSEVDKLYIDKLEQVPTGTNSLKGKVDKLDFDRLVPVLFDLSKLSDTAKNEVVKKDAYNVKIKGIEDKIPDIAEIATITTFIANINEV